MSETLFMNIILLLCIIGVAIAAISIIIKVIWDSVQQGKKPQPYQSWNMIYGRKQNYADVKALAKRFIILKEAIAVQQIGEHSWTYKPAHILIFEDGIALYRADLKLILAPHRDSLRGMFYITNSGKVPKLRLHVSNMNYWHIVEFDTTDFRDIREMDIFRNALNKMMPDEVRRQSAMPPPHIHYGTSDAYSVEQRITGEWKLKRYAMFYLTPIYLVFMEIKGKIIREIPLEAISNIEAMPRMDDDTTGILRFRADGELFTFTLADYEKWASQLALAASRAQEIPIESDFIEIKKKMEG